MGHERGLLLVSPLELSLDIVDLSVKLHATPTRSPNVSGVGRQGCDWPLRSEIYTNKAMASIRLEGNHLLKTEAEYEASNPHIN